MDENNPVPKKKKSKPPHRPRCYKPEYCQMLIDHLTKGHSFESFGGRINMGYSTMYTWVDPKSPVFEPDFLEAKEIGLTLGLKVWERIGKKGMLGQHKTTVDTNTRDGGISTLKVAAKFNAVVWAMTMKNRYPKLYRDRVENVNVDEDGKVIEPKSTVVLNILDNGRDKKKE